MGTVPRFGENGLVARITKEFRTQNPSTVKGIGNDSSVINNIDRLTLVSTDMLLEGIHFDLTYFPLKHLGYNSAGYRDVIWNRVKNYNIPKTYILALFELFCGNKNQSAHTCTIVERLVIDTFIEFICGNDFN